MILVKILIVLLAILIVIQLYNLFKRFMKRKEGFGNMEGLENMATDKKTIASTYTETDLNADPLYLAKLNAASITYLKEQVDKLNGLKEQVATLNAQTDNNSTAITALGEQLTLTSQELTGRDPNNPEPFPEVTGLD